MPLSEMIIYELHTGCFSPSHDFRGVIGKLDHLADLGINAIELMPIVLEYLCADIAESDLNDPRYIDPAAPEKTGSSDGIPAGAAIHPRLYSWIRRHV